MTSELAGIATLLGAVIGLLGMGALVLLYEYLIGEWPENQRRSEDGG